MLRTLIVEDEIPSQETLKNFLKEYCPEVELLAVTDTVKEGVCLVNKLKPDLLLLDIALNNGTGFDLLKQVQERNFEVIFTTAYEHYALRAIKFSAIDYLLKPIDLDELQVAVKKVISKQQSLNSNRQIDTLLSNLLKHNIRQHTITLSTSEGLHFVVVEDIIRLEALGSYTQFHLINDKKIVVSKHLKEYERLLGDINFCRIHQSHLINIKAVVKYQKSDGGYVLLKDNSKIKVSESKKDFFLMRMKTPYTNL